MMYLWYTLNVPVPMLCKLIQKHSIWGRPAPMYHSLLLWLKTQEVLGSNPGRVRYVCHIKVCKLISDLVCAVLSLVLCLIKPLKSFDTEWIPPSPDFGLPCVAT